MRNVLLTLAALSFLTTPHAGAETRLRLAVFISGSDPNWDFEKELAARGVERVHAPEEVAARYDGCSDAKCRADISRELRVQAIVSGSLSEMNQHYAAQLTFYDARSKTFQEIRHSSHIEMGDAPFVDAIVGDWVARLQRKPSELRYETDHLEEQFEAFRWTAVQACTWEQMKAAFSPQPGEDWRLSFRFAIGAGGEVERIEADKSGRVPSELETCLRRALESGRFLRSRSRAASPWTIVFAVEDFVRERERVQTSLRRPEPISTPAPEVPRYLGPDDARIAAIRLLRPIRGWLGEAPLLMFPISTLVWTVLAISAGIATWRFRWRRVTVWIARGYGIWLSILAVLTALLLWTGYPAAEVTSRFALLVLPLLLPGVAAFLLASRLARRQER